MPRIRFRGVSFAYDEQVPLFRDVTLDLGPGGHGLVGDNGAGKSTFLALVSGTLAPDAGEVVLEPASGVVALCAQRVDEPGDDERALAEGLGFDAGRIADELHLDPAELERWSTLSPGERKRWQIGAALARDPDVLLLDEPTNHLDLDGRRRLIRALRRFRGVGIYVSHDRALLDELTQGTLQVAKGTVARWAGGYSAARESWEAERARAIDDYQRDKREHAKAERKLADERDARASAERQRSTAVRAKGKHDSDARTLGARTLVEWAEAGHGRRVAREHGAVERAKGALATHDVSKVLGRSVFVDWAPAPRARVLSLVTAELRRGDRVIARDLSVTLGREARVHLAGPNGAGKTTLVEALLEAATIPRERVLHLPQELGADRERAALDALRALPREVKSRALSLVAALGLDPDRLLASRAPSPGEARKILLAEGLARHVWAVVLDEPTNHLDLTSIERVEAALADYPGALLLVSHDARFAEALTHERWSLEPAVDGAARLVVV